MQTQTPPLCAPIPTRTSHARAFAVYGSIVAVLLLAACADPPPPKERPREQWSDEESGAYGDSQRALESLTDCVLNYSRNAQSRGLARDGIVDAAFTACARIETEYKEYTLSWATFHVTDAMRHPRRHKTEIEEKITALNQQTVQTALDSIRAQAQLILPHS